MTRPEVLVVSGEALWPPAHGGRLRTARVAQVLAEQMAVRVLAPVEVEPPIDLRVEPLPDEGPSRRLTAAMSASPRLGQSLLGPQRQRRLADVVARHRPEAVLYAHSYLAAVAPDLGVPATVQFTDVEVRRMASLGRTGGVRSRLAYGLEWAKARRWEPRVARRAALSIAMSPADLALLSSWGATAVLVPNGADSVDAGPSPADGPVTFVAGFGYRANLDAARFLLDEVWPRLRSAAPDVCLRLVGRQASTALTAWDGAPGIEVVSDPDDIEPYYRDASVVVAPVRTGGGAQLKLTEALAKGRVVVATSFTASTAPPGAEAGVVIADQADHFAARVLGLYRDPAKRWARERSLVACRPVPTWEDACAPLVDALLRPLARPRP